MLYPCNDGREYGQRHYFTPSGDQNLTTGQVYNSDLFHQNLILKCWQGQFSTLKNASIGSHVCGVVALICNSIYKCRLI